MSPPRRRTRAQRVGRLVDPTCQAGTPYRDTKISSSTQWPPHTYSFQPRDDARVYISRMRIPGSAQAWFDEKPYGTYARANSRYLVFREITIHRDLQTGRLKCVCGDFEDVDGVSVRLHALLSHLRPVSQVFPLTIVVPHSLPGKALPISNTGVDSDPEDFQTDHEDEEDEREVDELLSFVAAPESPRSIPHTIVATPSAVAATITPYSHSEDTPIADGSVATTSQPTPALLERPLDGSGVVRDDTRGGNITSSVSTSGIASPHPGEQGVNTIANSRSNIAAKGKRRSGQISAVPDRPNMDAQEPSASSVGLTTRRKSNVIAKTAPTRLDPRADPVASSSGDAHREPSSSMLATADSVSAIVRIPRPKSQADGPSTIALDDGVIILERPSALATNATATVNPGPKRRRGRPSKHSVSFDAADDEANQFVPRRGVGRPRKATTSTPTGTAVTASAPITTMPTRKPGRPRKVQAAKSTSAVGNDVTIRPPTNAVHVPVSAAAVTGAFVVPGTICTPAGLPNYPVTFNLAPKVQIQPPVTSSSYVNVRASTSISQAASPSSITLDRQDEAGLSMPIVTDVTAGIKRKRDVEQQHTNAPRADGPPAKQPHIEVAQVEVPKRKVGRPRKSIVVLDQSVDAEGLSVPVAGPSVPPKRKPGRPRKSVSAETTAQMIAEIANPLTPAKRKVGRPKKNEEVV